jgi:hypothetical protein
MNFGPSYKEAIMSTLNKGRSLEQQTHDGTSSIATMGAGCTGRRNLSQSQQGNQQSADTAGPTTCCPAVSTKANASTVSRPVRNTGKANSGKPGPIPSGAANADFLNQYKIYC